MLRTTLPIAITAALVYCAPAHAVELKAPWGQAIIDDNPFVNPKTGAPAGPNQAFPRGQVRDTASDDMRASIRVYAFSKAGGRALAEPHVVDEYHAVWTPFDRALNLDAAGPPIAYLRYDLCKVNGANDSTPECLPSHRIFRPAPPAPPASPALPAEPVPVSETELLPTEPTPTPPPPVTGIQLPSAKGCLAVGERLELRLVIKRRARAKILRVEFEIKRSNRAKRTGALVVDRRKPYRRTLPVKLPAGTRSRGYVHVYYRLPGSRKEFKWTESKRFTTCA